MRPIRLRPASNRPLVRALLGSGLLLLATLLVPLSGLIALCSMQCCDGMISSPFVQSAEEAACAERCGVTSSTAAPDLPDAVAASPNTSPHSVLPLAAGEVVSATPSSRPSATAVPLHASPGDAPLYIYNSAFLI
jgi:hypothetical protein